MDTTSSRMLLAIIIAATISSVACAEVTIPPGFEIVQITDFNSGWNTGTDINDCGEIAFFSGAVGPRFQIMHYDNGSLRQVTNDEHGGGFPKINDDGTMIWGRRLVNWGPVQIVRYKDGVLTILAEDPEQMQSGKSVNNLDQIAWTQTIDPPGACATFDYELMFHDGDTITQLTGDEAYLNSDPELSAEDEMVWAQVDYCLSPSEGKLLFHAAGVFTDVFPMMPLGFSVSSINDLGQVSWSLGNQQIVVWENGVTQDAFPFGWNPKINIRGSIFFIRPFGPAWEAFMLHEGVVYQLTDTSSINSFGSINNWDECAWQAEGSGASEIAHLRRIRTGDAEFDGDVDLSDHNAMANCMTGHGRVDRLCDCRFLDIDHDGDVDLMDVAIFNNNFTGG